MLLCMLLAQQISGHSDANDDGGTDEQCIAALHIATVSILRINHKSRAAVGRALSEIGLDGLDIGGNASDQLQAHELGLLNLLPDMRPEPLVAGHEGIEASGVETG